MGGRTLVSMPHGRGIAAVVREGDRRAWLVEDVGTRSGGTRITGHRPSFIGLEADVTLAGGLLPDGAVRAVVRDRAEREHDATCGAEAWLALLPEPIRGESPVVRLLDAAGEVVATPLPAGVELAPVEDADEPCPVCGAADWGRVVAAPEGRYGSDGAGRPTAAVCRRCGHEESLGVMYGPGAGGAVTDPDLIAELEERRARHLAAPAPSTRFPLLGLAGRRPSVVDRSQHGDELVSVTLAFDTAAGRVTVETSSEEARLPADWAAREALQRLLEEDGRDWPDGSETAVSLWLNARSRAQAAVAAAAPTRELSLPVDGEPTPFAAVAHGDRFAAVAELARGIAITISGRGDPAALALDLRWSVP